MSDITNKPDIEFEPARGIGYIKPTKKQLTQNSNVYTKEILLAEANGLKESADAAILTVETEISKFAVTTKNVDVAQAVGSLIDSMPIYNISYPVYLLSITKDGASARLVQGVFEDESVSIWGDAAVRLIGMLSAVSAEATNIINFLNSTDYESPELFFLIAKTIYDCREYVVEAYQLLYTKEEKVYKKELQPLKDDNIREVQATLNDAIELPISKLNAAESSLKQAVGDSSSTVYGSVAPSLLKRDFNLKDEDTTLTKIISFAKENDEDKTKLIKRELDNRSTQMAEAMSEILSNVKEIKALQVINKGAILAGGVQESSVSDTYVDSPDTDVWEMFRENLETSSSSLSGNVTEEAVSPPMDDVYTIVNSLPTEKSVQTFVEVSREEIISELSYQETEIFLDLTWGENLADIEDTEETPYALSHDAGAIYFVNSANGEFTSKAIIAGRVSDTSGSYPVNPYMYWLYALYSPNEEIARIHTSLTVPTGDNVIRLGLFDCTE